MTTRKNFDDAGYYIHRGPFDGFHKDLYRVAKKHGAIIIYESPYRMTLQNWQKLSNVELLIEIGKGTPIMEDADTPAYQKKNHWRKRVI